MSDASARYEFAPPPTPGLLRALGLAILAHAALVAALTLGVQWRHTAAPVTVEAELWSAVPEQAAPPAPPVEEVIEPQPKPPEPEPAPPEPKPDPQIAIAKEKARLKKEKLEQQEQLEREKKEKLQKEKLLKEKLEREKEAKTAESDKDKNAKKAKEDAKRAKELAAQRQANLDRAMKMAGGPVGNGDVRSTGTAAQSSGPSAGYAGRIRARIKPNITFMDNVAGNPTAEVEVRTSPDGTIISRRLTQSSGVKSWDEVVLNAIDKTEVLPRDTDGRVPTSLVISFRPKD